MNDQVNSQRADNPNAPLKDQMELLKFLREEAEANRRAQREEADANRKLLTDTFKIISPILVVVIALAGFFWFHDLATLKEAIKNEGEAEAKVEIEKMHKHIDETLQARFEKEEIQKTITSAAEAATQKEAKPLIEAGVKSQVREAVAQQSGTIQRIATQAVADRVQETINPLAKRVGESVADLHIHELIALANADDAKALDELSRLKNTGSPSQQKLIKSLLSGLNTYARAQHSLDQTYTFPVSSKPPPCPNPQSYLRTASASSDVTARLTAILDCSAWADRENQDQYWLDNSMSPFQIEEQMAPELVRIALEDPSVSVRTRAVVVINVLFSHSDGFPSDGFELSDLDGLKGWWREKESTYPSELLLSRLSAFSGGDMSDLYDEISRVRANSPPAQRKPLDHALAVMRSEASSQPALPILKKNLGRDSCTEVGNDFDLRMQEWNRRPEIETNDTYGTWEIQFLQACPIVPRYLHLIVGFATTSHTLSRRYAAAMVLNKWVNANLDPFNTKGIQDWWVEHKAEYGK